MKLNPTIAPGRPNRKARAFAEEIARLVMEGYSCKAIHQALTDAGLSVHKSTVQREVARLTKPTRPTRPTDSRAAVSRTTRLEVEASPSPPSPRLPAAGGQQSGKEMAAEFMKSRITNPLFRNRS